MTLDVFFGMDVHLNWNLRQSLMPKLKPMMIIIETVQHQSQQRWTGPHQVVNRTLPSAPYVGLTQVSLT